MSKVKFSFATPEEHEVAAKNRTGFARPLSLSPLEAYLGLKALFGEPNRQYIDETAQQWVFMIKTKDAQIEVNDWKLESWSIHVYDQNNDVGRSEHLIKELEKQITHALAKHRSLLSDLLKSPAGHVIDSVLPSLMSDIGIEEVNKIKAIVDASVAQLLSNMKPRDRKGFESVMFEEFINVEYHDGVFIILG